MVICSNSHGCELSFLLQSIVFASCTLIVAPRLIRTSQACLWIFKWAFGVWDFALCIGAGVISIQDGGIVNLWIELPVTINGFRQGRTLIVASRMKHKSRNPQIPFFLHHSSNILLIMLEEYDVRLNTTYVRTIKYPHIRARTPHNRARIPHLRANG